MRAQAIAAAAGCVAALGLQAMLVPAARADVLFDSLGTCTTINPQIGQSVARRLMPPGQTFSARRSGVSFVLGGNGSYMLDAITLPLSRSSLTGTVQSLRVRLAVDNGGVPGSTLEVLAETLAPPTYPLTAPASAITLTSPTRPVLQGGMKYWLVLELSGNTALTSEVTYIWHQGELNTPPMEWIAQTTTGAFPSDPWPTTTVPVTFPLRVEASPATASCCNRAIGVCAVLPRTECRASMGLTPGLPGSTCALLVCLPPCRADINGFGGVTVQDLFEYLSLYFGGC